MSFIKNLWYVAAWSNEVAEAPIGRTIIGEPVVLYRVGDGTLVAMADRCPHRHAQLSLGRIEGNELRCMYHGLKFGTDGHCVHIPGSETLPPNTQVRTYPVVERDSWAWIWMGDPAQADPALIPQAFGIDNEKWAMREGVLDYEANYELINDNLTDLSHLDFVHETTLGAASGALWSNDQPKIATLDHGIRVDRWFTDVQFGPDPAMRSDNWSSYHYLLPGVFVMIVKMCAAGTAEASNGDEPLTPPMLFRVEQQAVTPIDATRTRYFYATGFEANKIPPEALESSFEIIQAAFAEDKLMIEAQQRIWNLTPPETPKAFIPQDKGPSIFRRLIARRLAGEAVA